MTTMQIAALVAVMAAVTFLTRALPFLLFGRGGDPPKVVLYLGRFLPPAVIAMLIVYCYRNTSFAAQAAGPPASFRGRRSSSSTSGRKTTCCPLWGAPSSICSWCRRYSNRLRRSCRQIASCNLAAVC